MKLINSESPDRPPDWRWERARWFNDKGRYVRAGVEDPFVCLVKRYQVMRNRCKDELELESLERKFPALYKAHEIRNNTNSNTRWAIEARLISGQDFQKIADESSLKIDTIRWYEAVFFNILDRLKSRDYICNVVIGTSLHAGVIDRDNDVLWKLFGYFGGPDVADAAITTDVNSNAMIWFDKDTAGTISRKASIAARSIPIAFNQQTIFEYHNKLKEIERDAGLSGAAHNVMIDNVREMMNVIGGFYAVGKNRGNVKELEDFDLKAAELRANETVLATQHRLVIDNELPDSSIFNSVKSNEQKNN